MQNEIITENYPRILIVGWGRAGKDELAGFLNSVGYDYGGSTSWAALPYVSAALKMHPQLCWEHRHQNRMFWKEFCDGLRKDDPCFLIRIAQNSGRVITGVRALEEIQAAKAENLFDFILWVHRFGNPADPTVTFSSGHATQVIFNNGGLRELHLELLSFLRKNNLPIQHNDYTLTLDQ